MEGLSRNSLKQINFFQEGSLLYIYSTLFYAPETIKIHIPSEVRWRTELKKTRQ